MQRSGFGIDRFDPHMRMDRDVPSGQMMRQQFDDPPGQQHAAAFQMAGFANPIGCDQRELAAKLGSGQPADAASQTGQCTRAVVQPRGIVGGGYAERAGRHVQRLAQVGPKPVPGVISLIDHGGIARFRPVGVADQAVLIDRGAERIGNRVLVVNADPVPPAGQRPGGGQAHDAGSDDGDVHAHVSMIPQVTSTAYWAAARSSSAVPTDLNRVIWL